MSCVKLEPRASCASGKNHASTMSQYSLSNRSSRTFLASSHSHTTITFQPIASSSACCLISRSWLRSSFALQNSTFDFGTRVAFGQFSCICQKQPLMNTIVRYFGNTTSGCPGYRLSFLRNRRPFEKKKTAYHHFDGGVFASDMRHDVASRATLIFLFFRGFPRFSGLLNVFLRCHSTPLWQDPAKSGKSEKHPDKTQCKCETDQRALRSCMAYAGTCNAAIININEPTLFMQFTKDGS